MMYPGFILAKAPYSYPLHLLLSADSKTVEHTALCGHQPAARATAGWRGPYENVPTGMNVCKKCVAAFDKRSKAK